MKKILTLLFFVPLITISQNTWDGSAISTHTLTGAVGIGSAPAASSMLRVVNSSRAYSISNTHNTTRLGTEYGIHNSFSSSGASGNKYGIFSSVSGASPNKYGIYAQASSSGTYSGGSALPATSYALYATASGASTRAGYFDGDVEMKHSNTIYSNNNGTKALLYTTSSSFDNGFQIAINQTAHEYDWDWGTNLILFRSGEMRKHVKSSEVAFVIHRADHAADVFRIYGDGKVYATEVNIRLASNFPDYVFLPSYNLRSIDDLSNFIKQNGKLPNMPSAAEVEKEGLDIGETSRLLVEKIEELTLYIIQQQEIIKKQDDRLKILEEKITSK
jgi:hypothetical protein